MASFEVYEVGHTHLRGDRQDERAVVNFAVGIQVDSVVVQDRDITENVVRGHARCERKMPDEGEPASVSSSALKLEATAS